MQAIVNTETVFRKGSHVVQIEQTWGGKNELVVLNEHGMKNLLSEVAACLKNVNVTGSSGAKGTMSVPIAPPSKFAKSILSQTQKLPPLSKVKKIPHFMPGGQLREESGYDPETGDFLDLAGTHNVPENPTTEEVQERVALWEEGLEGFPFEDSASRANTFAMALEQFVRPMIPGPTPIYCGSCGVRRLRRQVPMGRSGRP